MSEFIAGLPKFDIGNTIQLSGMVFSDNEKDYILRFPMDQSDNEKVVLDMSHGDWVQFIQQTDFLETEVLSKSSDGTFAKIVLRKSSRQIDQCVSWKVFHRDMYMCRYCGASEIPLTVDHVVLWEDGGPSIEENLLSACKKCNKTRGNMKYEDWLRSKEYKARSTHLNPSVKVANEQVVNIIPDIPIRLHKKSR